MAQRILVSHKHVYKNDYQYGRVYLKHSRVKYGISLGAAYGG